MPGGNGGSEQVQVCSTCRVISLTHGVLQASPRGALDVKNGKQRTALPGMNAFHDAHKPARMLLVGEGGISIEEFLSEPASKWLA